MARRLKSPRLSGFDYAGPLAAHLVFVTRERKPLFANPDLAGICVASLLEVGIAVNATLHAYCVMPDHVHILAEVSVGTRITEFARRIKQLSGYRLKRLLGESIWQVSYYNHVLRADEDTVGVARYIWSNPVNEGLEDSYVAYPFSGSLETMTALNNG